MRSMQRGLLCAGVAAITAAAAGTALAQAGNEWSQYGADASNTRFSSLNQINTGNVKNLKVLWAHSMGTLESQESTPVVVDGTMYVTSSTGPRYVFALDAKTGARKWTYQPEMPADYMSTVCCGLDNRGVAVANGKVFYGRLDAKLEALDAKTGKRLWTVTVADYKRGHAITSAPLIVKDLVITGIAGGEYGIRGFVTAYKQSTGEQVWKTYTIPGPGEPGHESWKGDSWKTGGGSTWGVGSYDAGRNTVYWSTSNAGPWGAQTRGTDSSDYGPYSNQWTASQLAFDADTGAIKWGYQYTPHDAWDYDGINEGVLTDLDIGGKKVPALMHADRNGFFYVLNRETGKVVSAEPFVTVNWATHVDLESGRPVEAANNEKRPQLGKWARNVCPNLIGGKNWSPMSYSKADRVRVSARVQHVHGHRQPRRGVLARQVLSRLRVQPRHAGRHGLAPGRVHGLGSGREEAGLEHRGAQHVGRRCHDHGGRAGVLRQPGWRAARGECQDGRGAVAVPHGNGHHAEPHDLHHRRQAVRRHRGRPAQGTAFLLRQDRPEDDGREP
ncbi:MAG: PQQ-dependent dehydrogenase, methanol/ethanol family [Betaproteobacteria bacterium]|nr:PQQ-dependent dehydrogenase, methanol/ethanol family [Betaproteobacteria bacterium]